MADWFAGKATHCSDANGGTTWADAKLTITSLLTVAYAAGDRLLVGPGVYRETVTIDASGQATFNAGTVSVTNESAIVAGAGFVAGGVVAGDQLFIGNFESGVNGQTWGTNSFTVAGGTGNFQAGMVGFMIEIMTKGAYIIASIVTADSITLLDPHHAPGAPVWPAASGGFNLDFYVVSGEGPYEIASVLAAQLTLVKPWSGPTLTGLDYQIFLPVYLIADTTGVETDLVGGVVRITGTDNDETKTRNYGITNDWWVAPRSYWAIRGFRIDNCDQSSVYISDDCTYWTFEDISTIDYSTYGFEIWNCTQMTFRRIVVLGGAIDNGGYGFDIGATVNVDNAHILVENVYANGGVVNVSITDLGGSTIKNLTSGFNTYWDVYGGSANTGAAVFVHDCLLHFASYEALEASALGQVVEQHNNFWSNGTDRLNVFAATNSTAYAYLPALPLLGDSVRWPMVPFFAPSEWEPTRAAAGLYGKNDDMFGVHNEVAQTRRSWGAMHQYPTKRDTTVAYGAFTAAQEEDDSMEQMHVWNVQEARTYTITVQVYLDANYTGNNPQMTVSQPGQADVIATSTGAKGSWEQLTATFTTGAALDWIAIFLKSRNTSALANRSVRWQDLDVR